MFGYVWPIGLVVISNIIYQICAKSSSEQVNPFAALTVTYLVAALISALLFLLLGKGANLWKEYAGLNWAPFVLGVVIVGLEAGFLFAYQAGWQVSTASLVQSAFLTVALIFVGRLLYGEPITVKKLLGAGLCLAGLFFINAA